MSNQNNTNNGDGTKSLEEMFNHADDLSKLEAIKILSDHLEGSWDNLTEDELEMGIITGGFVNRLFVCENKKLSGKESSLEPSKVIIRLMGGKVLDKYSDKSILNTHGEVVESLNYVFMDQAGLGPKIYGVFKGGRIEEFIESKIISDRDLMDPQYTSAFARKLARIHNLRPPIIKKPKDMFGIIKKIKDENLADYLNKMKDVEVPPGLEPAAKAWFDFDIFGYIDWMFEIFPSIKTRVVFSHNDMNRANCIIREGSGTENMTPLDKVILIDYEFCCYLYRGCDIGQHFFNRTIDVTKIAGKDLSKGDVDYFSKLGYPSEEERRHFIEEYIDEVKKLGTYQLDSAVDSVESMLIESEYFGGLWNLFHCMWIVRDHDMFVGKGFGKMGMLFAYMADHVKNLTERKSRILDLKTRYPNH